MSAIAGKIIGGIILTAGAGFGSYNYMTTGCPLGSKEGCSTSTDAAASVNLVAADAATDAGGCCPLSGAEVEMVSVANEADACSTEKADCETACDSGAALMTVANETDAADCAEACETTECDAATECDKACPSMAETTADEPTATLSETSSAGAGCSSSCGG